MEKRVPTEPPEQIIAKPEATEFMNEKEIGQMDPKEKIAVWMAQQEHKNPGFIEDHLSKNGMMKFSTGHYVMKDNISSGLPRIWAPGEHEAEQNKNWKDNMPGTFKSAVTKTIVSLLKAAASDAAKKPFAKLSTGKKVFAGIQGKQGVSDAKIWEQKHGDFSPEEHNEAARLHLDAAVHSHVASDIEARDEHMQDAVEHIARTGKASKWHKDYTRLLDKFYDTE